MKQDFHFLTTIVTLARTLRPRKKTVRANFFMYMWLRDVAILRNFNNSPHASGSRVIQIYVTKIGIQKLTSIL